MRFGVLEDARIGSAPEDFAAADSPNPHPQPPQDCSHRFMNLCERLYL